MKRYCDASWANTEDFSSFSGFAFLFGSAFVSWTGKKQRVNGLSSTEAEYAAVTSEAQEAVWFQELLNKIAYKQECIVLFKDNEASINLIRHP